MRCKFSHLKNSCAPVSAFAVDEVSTGVRCATPASRACAATTSAYEMASSLITEYSSSSRDQRHREQQQHAGHREVELAAPARLGQQAADRDAEQRPHRH